MVCHTMWYQEGIVVTVSKNWLDFRSYKRTSDSFITCKIPSRSFIDLSCTSVALCKRFARALRWNLPVAREARGMVRSLGLQSSLAFQDMTSLDASLSVRRRCNVRLIPEVLLRGHGRTLPRMLLRSVGHLSRSGGEISSSLSKKTGQQ